MCCRIISLFVTMVDLLKLFICFTVKFLRQKTLLDARISEISRTYVKLEPILSQISFQLQRESVGVKFDWQHSMAHPRKPPYRRTNLADISYTNRVIANFVPNFVAIATGFGRRKMRLAAFNGTSSKTPLQTHKCRRYLLHRPSYNQFCLEFRCHGNGSGLGKNAIGSIRWLILESLPIDAQISQISLTQTEL